MGHDGHNHPPGHSHDHDHGHHHHRHPHRDHGHSHVADEHHAAAPAHVSAFVITCSDTRNEKQDESGRIIRALLEDRGHHFAGYELVKDDGESIRAAIERAVEAGARAVIVNGGTGIGPRDVTIETVGPMFEKRLDGFGELFRSLSYKEIGSAAMMSRAAAGTFRGAIVFCLPGSPQAVRTAMDLLILPEVGHAVRELSR